MPRCRPPSGKHGSDSEEERISGSPSWLLQQGPSIIPGSDRCVPPSAKAKPLPLASIAGSFTEPSLEEIPAVSDPDLKASNRRPALSRTLIAVVLLSLSNVGLAVAAGIAWRRLDDQTRNPPSAPAANAYCASPSTSYFSRAVFSAQHSLPGSAPVLIARPNISSTRMQRSHTYYAGTFESNYTVASGVTQIVKDNQTLYEVHIEYAQRESNPQSPDPVPAACLEAGDYEFVSDSCRLLNNTNFGEYAGGNGAVGNRAFQLRIVDVPTQAELVLVPLSFSLVASKATLVPNAYFFSYRAAPIGSDCCGIAPYPDSCDCYPEAVASFASTVMGRMVFYNDVGMQSWDAFMPAFFQVYDSIALTA